MVLPPSAFDAGKSSSGGGSGAAGFLALANAATHVGTASTSSPRWRDPSMSSPLKKQRSSDGTRTGDSAKPGVSGRACVSQGAARWYYHLVLHCDRIGQRGTERGCHVHVRVNRPHRPGKACLHKRKHGTWPQHSIRAPHCFAMALILGGIATYCFRRGGNQAAADGVERQDHWCLPTRQRAPGRSTPAHQSGVTEALGGIAT